MFDKLNINTVIKDIQEENVEEKKEGPDIVGTWSYSGTNEGHGATETTFEEDSAADSFEFRADGTGHYSS